MTGAATRNLEARSGGVPWPAVAVVIAAAAVALWGEGLGLPASVTPAAGLIVLTIGFWATGALPEHLTALLFFLIAIVTGLAPADVVFSGFASTALWLVFSGLVLAGAVDRAGVAAALASRLTARVGSRYWHLIAALVGLGSGLAFVVPSTMGRVLLLLPLVLGLADRLGYAEGSRGRAGMVVATMLSTFLVACAILPANVPNLVMVGAAEAVLGLPIRYGDYFVLHFPVLGAAKAALIVAVVAWLFHDRPVATDHAATPAAIGPDGTTLSVILLVTLALWATDSVHGVSPAWVGLAAALICLWPGVAIVPAATFTRQINLAPLFYVAGVLGVARLTDASGLGAAISTALLEVLPGAEAGDMGVFFSLSALATAIGVVATMPGVPVALTPIATDVAGATGWSVEAVVMTQVMGFSTVVLPYQVPPLVVGAALAGLRLGDVARATLVLTAVTVVVLWPLAYLWWRALGVFGGP